MRAEELFHMFPQVMRSRWEQVAGLADRLQEIRLRVNVPAAVWIDNREWFVDAEGMLMDRQPGSGAYRAEELEMILKHLCQYSVYPPAERRGGAEPGRWSGKSEKSGRTAGDIDRAAVHERGVALCQLSVRWRRPCSTGRPRSWPRSGTMWATCWAALTTRSPGRW